MITLQSFNGETVYLSDETYQLISDPYFADENYKAGSIVRLISGVDGHKKPGYHFNKDYITVCRVGAESAEFHGVLKSNLRRL